MCVVVGVKGMRCEVWVRADSTVSPDFAGKFWNARMFWFVRKPWSTGKSWYSIDSVSQLERFPIVWHSLKKSHLNHEHEHEQKEVEGNCPPVLIFFSSNRKNEEVSL